MPILNVEIVGEIEPELSSGLASRLADSAGVALNSRPQGTWVKLHFLAADQYSENEGGAPVGALPVIASLILAEPPIGEALQNLITVLTDAISNCVGRPRENVHIIVEPPAIGRIAFGGVVR